MMKIIFAVLCLSCASDGRRLHQSVAFSPSSHSGRFSVGTPGSMVQPGRSVLQSRNSHGAVSVARSTVIMKEESDVPQRATSTPTMSETLALEQSTDNKEPEVVEQLVDLLVTVLRIGTCMLMIHHGFDKVENVAGFSANVVSKFFGFLPGPAEFWTYSAAATQIAGACILALGVFSRPVALSMTITMLVAVVFHLLNTGPEAFPFGIPKAHSYNYELAAMYVLVLSYFTVAGAGKYSIDEQILGGELPFYESLFNSVKEDTSEKAVDSGSP